MMEGNKTKPRALLVFGAPCSGRTTFATKFGKKFGLAYYNLDDLRDICGFSRENLLVILELIARTKQTVIIEGGIDTEKERVEIRNIFRNAGYAPALAWIQTDMSTIRSRLKAKFRSVAKAKKFYDEAVAEIEAPTEEEKPIILSGKHTFETQTKHVVVGLADLVETK